MSPLQVFPPRSALNAFSLPCLPDMRAPNLFYSSPQQAPPRLSSTRGNRGFTLVELIIVLGIILMILGFTAPAVVGILRGRKVEQALSVVSDVLERARIEAVTQNTYLWTGFLNVPPADSVSGQDELWILTFKSKTGESRISSPASILPYGPLRRVEGSSLVNKDKLPDNLSSLMKEGSSDFNAESVSSKALKWAGAGSSGAKNFDRLILSTPRGEALIETGNTDMPPPQAYLWFGLSKTSQGSVAPNEKDCAALSVSGLTGRVLVVRP